MAGPDGRDSDSTVSLESRAVAWYKAGGLIDGGAGSLSESGARRAEMVVGRFGWSY